MTDLTKVHISEREREIAGQYHERRNYPTTCLSAFCGRTECSGCPLEPRLREFKEWRERYNARQIDLVWTPTIYEATTDGQ